MKIKQLKKDQIKNRSKEKSNYLLNDRLKNESIGIKWPPFENRTVSLGTTKQKSNLNDLLIVESGCDQSSDICVSKVLNELDIRGAEDDEFICSCIASSSSSNNNNKTSMSTSSSCYAINEYNLNKSNNNNNNNNNDHQINIKYRLLSTLNSKPLKEQNKFSETMSEISSCVPNKSVSNSTIEPPSECEVRNIGMKDSVSESISSKSLLYSIMSSLKKINLKSENKKQDQRAFYCDASTSTTQIDFKTIETQTSFNDSDRSLKLDKQMRSSSSSSLLSVLSSTQSTYSTRFNSSLNFQQFSKIEHNESESNVWSSIVNLSTENDEDLMLKSDPTEKNLETNRCSDTKPKNFSNKHLKKSYSTENRKLMRYESNEDILPIHESHAIKSNSIGITNQAYLESNISLNQPECWSSDSSSSSTLSIYENRLSQLINKTILNNMENEAKIIDLLHQNKHFAFSNPLYETIESKDEKNSKEKLTPDFNSLKSKKSKSVQDVTLGRSIGVQSTNKQDDFETANKETQIETEFNYKVLNSESQQLKSERRNSVHVATNTPFSSSILQSLEAKSTQTLSETNEKEEKKNLGKCFLKAINMNKKFKFVNNPFFNRVLKFSSNSANENNAIMTANTDEKLNDFSGTSTSSSVLSLLSPYNTTSANSFKSISSTLQTNKDIKKTMEKFEKINSKDDTNSIYQLSDSTSSNKKKSNNLGYQILLLLKQNLTKKKLIENKTEEINEKTKVNTSDDNRIYYPCQISSSDTVVVKYRNKNNNIYNRKSSMSLLNLDIKLPLKTAF